ncbi:hypothetical protein [Bradyrhizobium sp.]|uniref:hypothetical protein n=1 Tax=Bradyrhizobium sp. TaxID=376 RepID=UPI003C74BCA1
MQVSAVSRVHSSRPVNTGSSTFLPSTKEGRVEALVGQRPFEMGYKAPTDR